MLARVKNIHPGWLIAGFFFILIVFNVIFFVIAASEPVDLLPAKPAATSPAPPAAPGDVAPEGAAPR